MIIRQNTEDIEHLMPLLLIGDEADKMIRTYASSAKIIPSWRNQGIGHIMLEHVESLYPEAKFRLGTGGNPFNPTLL